MNDDTLVRIGHKISTLRQKAGLTQAELASKMGTSQSAINRIEKGGQNISIEVLERISETLKQPVVEISSGDISFEIEGGRELSGEIIVNTAKNSAMGLMCASLLNKSPTTLRNMPRIQEVQRMLEVFESVGVKCEWDESDLTITPPAQMSTDNINVQSAIKTRSIIMMMPALMHQGDDFNLPFAGGCSLGTRTVAPHLMLLSKFGLEIDVTEDEYRCSTPSRIAPGEVIAYEPGDTVSESAVMAAAITPGVTTLRYITANYAIQDVCFMLEKMGVKIEGIGTTTLRVHGLKQIDAKVDYYVSEDPIEAMTLTTAAIVTNSEVTVRRVPIRFMEFEIMKLRDMNIEIEVGETYMGFNQRTELVDIVVKKHNGNINAPTEKLHSLPYPGLNADNLMFFAPIACMAQGQTLVHDWMYENRAVYLNLLNKLGANIQAIDVHRVNIFGSTDFKPADIEAPPALRPSVILLLAMMAAPGKSKLTNVYPVRRGYESLSQRLNSIGASIHITQGI